MGELYSVLPAIHGARDELADVVRRTLSTAVAQYTFFMSPRNTYPAWARFELIEAPERLQHPIELTIIAETDRHGAILHSAVINKGRDAIALKRVPDFSRSQAEDWARYAAGKGPAPLPSRPLHRCFRSGLKYCLSTGLWAAPRLLLLAKQIANRTGIARNLLDRLRHATKDFKVPELVNCSIEVPFQRAPWLVARNPALAVLCHIYHTDLAAEVISYLQNIPFAFDLFISTDTIAKRSSIQDAFACWSKGRVEIRVVANRGRDIAPMLVSFRDAHDNYAYILHIHTKKSGHTDHLSDWRYFLFETLLGSPVIVKSVFAAFQVNPSLGMVGPARFEGVRKLYWGQNFSTCYRLGKQLGFTLSKDGPLEFPAGSMFWCRTAALRPLLDLGLRLEDFEEERGQIDGTLTHALERLFYFGCERAGFQWVSIARSDLYEQPEPVLLVDTAVELRSFIAKRDRLLINKADLNATNAPDRGHVRSSDRVNLPSGVGASAGIRKVVHRNSQVVGGLLKAIPKLGYTHLHARASRARLSKHYASEACSPPPRG